MRKYLLVITTLFLTALEANSFADTTVKAPFKTFLKNKNIPMDIDVPNEFETIQPGNKYANYYFGVYSMFPQKWEHDRGQSEYSLYRAYNLLESSVIALIAVPTEDSPYSTIIVDEFKKSPLRTMNKTSKGSYQKKLLDELLTNSDIKVTDFVISEEMVASTNYLKYEYEFYLVSEGNKTAFKTIGYQVMQKNVTYTIHYSTPVKHFDKKLILDCLQNTSYQNPK